MNYVFKIQCIDFYLIKMRIFAEQISTLIVCNSNNNHLHAEIEEMS